jgi:uncharacterized protein YjbI with pentapeptide repeats
LKEFAMQTILIRSVRLLQIGAVMFPLVAFAASARADIYQWEYINPADPSQGKRQSTTLAPDGAGVDAVPGAYLGYRNLTMAYLIGADLTGADGQLVNLTNADLRQANLSNAFFFFATLTGADWTDSDVRATNFEGTTFNGFTAQQLYTTASYQAHDMTGINLAINDLSGWNFAGQNLTNAFFAAANLTGANLSHANLTNAGFASRLPSATLTDTDFTGADSRGAFGLDISASAITSNLIRPDGHIHGLVLDAGGLLVVRDYEDSRYDPVRVIPITIDQHLAIGPGGTLRMVFEADAWDSTISFAPGIPVALGGTLELTFADDVNLSTQLGRTFDLFDWTGVTPTGTFAVSSPYRWDLSNLYTTGEVTLTAIPEPRTFVLFFAGLGMCILRRRKDALCQQQTTVFHAFRKVHSKHVDRRAGNGRPSSQVRTVPGEVRIPAVGAWMKERRQRAAVGIVTGDIDGLECIAVETTDAQVLGDGGSMMILRADVIDGKRERVERGRHAAIFAQYASARPHELAKFTADRRHYSDECDLPSASRARACRMASSVPTRRKPSISSRSESVSKPWLLRSMSSRIRSWSSREKASDTIASAFSGESTSRSMIADSWTALVDIPLSYRERETKARADSSASGVKHSRLHCSTI